MRRGGRSVQRPVLPRSPRLIAAEPPPTVTKPGTQTNHVGDVVNLAIASEHATSFEATGLPAGLAISPITGIISGTPSNVSTSTVIVGVSGPGGGPVTTTFEWVVSAALPLGFGARLSANLLPWLTSDLERYCEAIGVMFDPVLELVEEEGSDGEAGYVPAWGKLLNPELCPAEALPYLAQFVGVEIPAGTSESEARALLKGEAGLERGTLASIEGACARILGAGVSFAIEERTNANGEEDAYHFLVLVPPGKGSSGLVEAINAVKPAGVFFTVVEVEGAWLDGALTWEEIGAGVTWEALKEGNF